MCEQVIHIHLSSLSHYKQSCFHSLHAFNSQSSVHHNRVEDQIKFMPRWNSRSQTLTQCHPSVISLTSHKRLNSVNFFNRYICKSQMSSHHADNHETMFTPKMLRKYCNLPTIYIDLTSVAYTYFPCTFRPCPCTHLLFR